MAVALVLLRILIVPMVLAGAVIVAIDLLATGRPETLMRGPLRHLARPLRRLHGPIARVAELVPWRRRPAEPIPPVLIGLELRRLAEDIRRVEDGNQPAKAARLAASTWAYDYVLLDYCRSVNVPLPAERAPLTKRQRFDAEEALIGAGHDW